MEIIKTNFEGLFLIKLNTHSDSRGDFTELFKQNLFENEINFCQDNIVRSKKFVLRGLHFQKEPYAQTKLISVIEGEIFDVAVDLRKFSKTYGNYFSVKLSAQDNMSILIPKGFAHGYLTTSEKAIIHYKVDNYYNPDFEGGIKFDDKNVDIDWGVKKNNLIISERDTNFKNFKW